MEAYGNALSSKMMASESAKNLLDYRRSNDFDFIPFRGESTPLIIPVLGEVKTIEMQFSKEVNMLNSLMGEGSLRNENSFDTVKSANEVKPFNLKNPLS
jgi:hypothetical protein